MSDDGTDGEGQLLVPTPSVLIFFDSCKELAADSIDRRLSCDSSEMLLSILRREVVLPLAKLFLVLHSRMFAIPSTQAAASLLSS